MEFILFFGLLILLLITFNIVDYWETSYHGEVFCKVCGCEIESVWKYSSAYYDSKTGIGTRDAVQYQQCSRDKHHFDKIDKGRKTINVKAVCEDKK